MSGPKVLVVGDDHAGFDKTRLIELLEREGHDVEFVPSGDMLHGRNYHSPLRGDELLDTIYIPHLKVNTMEEQTSTVSAPSSLAIPPPTVLPEGGKRLDIVFYPDERLTQPSPSETIFGSGLKRFAADLAATCKAMNGAGIAAIQVGVPTAVIAIEVPGGYLVLVNPQVRPATPFTVPMKEGCLSFPGVFETTDRFAMVEVTAQDLDGNEVHYTLEGQQAQAVQHEVEHLAGITLATKAPFHRRDKIRTAMKQFHRRAGKLYGLSKTDVVAMYSKPKAAPQPAGA